MRPWAQCLLAVLAGILLFGPVTAQNPPKTSAQNPPAGQRNPQKPKTRLFIPGVGGAVPTRPKPAVTAPPTRSFYGLLPSIAPGAAPAQIQIPGQGPGLPGLGPGGVGPFPALQAVKVSPLIFGVNVIWGDNGEIENWDKDGGAKARRLAQVLKSMGATSTRFRIRWSEIEKERGKYDWTATDRFVNYVSGLRLTPVCLISGSADWAIDRSPEALNLLQQAGVSNLEDRLPPDPAFYPDFNRFVAALALRYKDRIRHWEFWGDVDSDGFPSIGKDKNGRPVEVVFGDAKAYTQLLKLFAASIRKTDPGARIAVGGLRTPDQDFITALYSAGAKPYFDAISLHPPSDRTGVPFEWIDRCREVMVKNGDAGKSFWITQWGWPTQSDNGESLSELHKARLVREAFEGMRVRPFVSLAEFQSLNDWRSDERDQSSLNATGLTALNMSAKPAYHAFREDALGVLQSKPHAYQTVRLIGTLPRIADGGVRPEFVNVTVDAGKPGRVILPAWDGFVQARDGGDYEQFAGAVERIKALRPNLIRFDPFPNPESVRPQGILIESAASSGPTKFPLNIEWTYTDRMIEAIGRTGAKPMLDFATMPSALSAPGGNSRLPRETAQWESLLREVAQRYCRDQKRGSFYWELSHEPDTGEFTLAEWLRFYDGFASTIVSADPGAKVGGPATSTFNFEWIKALIDHCAANKVPLHFVTWHAYNVKPAEIGRQVAKVREYLAKYPELKNVEPILGEWNLSAAQSPVNDGLPAAHHALTMAEVLSETFGARSLFYSVKDGPDFRARGSKLTGRWGLLSGENQPKPVYHAFLMLNRLEGRRLEVLSEETEIHALASLSEGRIFVVIWNNIEARERDGASADTPIRLRIDGIPWRSGTRGIEWLVDSQHGNVAFDSAAAELPKIATFDAFAGDPEIQLVLPPQGIAAVELRPNRSPGIEAKLDTPRYVNFSGGPIVLSGSVRNSSSVAQTVSVKLESSNRSIMSASALRANSILLKPGETRSLRFTANPPATLEGVSQFFQLKAGESSSSISVKLESPLRLRVLPRRVDLKFPGAATDSEAATGRFTAELENRADAPLKFGVAAGKQGEAVTVPARNSATVPLVIAAPSTKPGNYSVPVRVLLDQKIVASADALIGVPGLCKFTAKKPRIDGDLADWTEAMPLQIETGKSVQLTGGLSAQVLTQWDDENLYVAAVVNDLKHFQPFAPDEMERGDCVRISLDTKYDSSGHVKSPGKTHELGLALERERSVLFRFAGNRRGKGGIHGSSIAIRRVGNRTIYEAAIPWSELGGSKPQELGLAGFSVRVNDSDGVRHQFISLPDGDTGASAAMRFLGLRFVK